jgi:hypothetical protein
VLLTADVNTPNCSLPEIVLGDNVDLKLASESLDSSAAVIFNPLFAKASSSLTFENVAFLHSPDDSGAQVDTDMHQGNTASTRINASNCDDLQERKDPICKTRDECSVCGLSETMELIATCETNLHSDVKGDLNPCWKAPPPAPPAPPPPPPPPFTDFTAAEFYCWLTHTLPNVTDIAGKALAAEVDGGAASMMATGNLQAAWRDQFGGTYSQAASIAWAITSLLTLSPPQLFAPCCDVPAKHAYCSKWCNATIPVSGSPGWGCGIGWDAASEFRCDCSGCGSCK